MTPPASVRAVDGPRARADPVAARLMAGDHVVVISASLHGDVVLPGPHPETVICQPRQVRDGTADTKPSRDGQAS